MTREPVDAQRLSHLLWEVGAYTAALGEAALAGTTLTPATAGVLDVIAANPGTSIAEMARRHAASMQPHGLVAAFTVAAPQVIASLEGSGPIVIEYFGNGTFPIAEAMSIAVLEAVVHGLDLCAAVDWPASSIPPSPMHHTVGLLATMTEPVSFIEAATGRTSTPVLPVLC